MHAKPKEVDAVSVPVRSDAAHSSIGLSFRHFSNAHVCNPAVENISERKAKRTRTACCLNGHGSQGHQRSAS